MTTATVYRTCPLCEATCGIAIETDGDAVVGIRGDADDPFSKGYLCPKASGLRALHHDPDRLRAPLVRSGGELREASWQTAFDEAIGRLDQVRQEHGADGNAIYIGNPAAHSLDAMLYGPVLIRALGTKQRYSASSADQLPKMVTAALMFGGGLTIPVPDLDRTDRLLILGGNPLVSNGSLMTAPDVRARLDGIRRRGGKVVVLDPRRSETADRADEHHFVRPGIDALILLAMADVLFSENLVRLGAAAPYVHHVDEVRAIAARFSPDRVAARTGLSADTIRRLARDHAAAPSAACYGRIGTTCQEFGTLASWAVDLINILTGNLDRPGGAMFTTPAALPGRFKKRGDTRFGRFQSRVLGLPEMFGELPVATLADEILTPSSAAEGGVAPGHAGAAGRRGDPSSRERLGVQVRGLVTLAGNPLVSAPNAGRLAEAFASLQVRVAIDPYVNATTRLADVILPPPSALARASYDVALYQLAVRNVAKYSPPTFERLDGHPAEWEILLTLSKGLMGMAAAPLPIADDVIARELIARELGDAGLALDAAGVLAALGDRRGPGRLVDLLVRLGPYGDRFGARPGGLTVDALLDQPHGVDLGALVPALPDVVRTGDGRIDLAPALVVGDLPRLEASLTREVPEVVLIGRRHLRSNNSWMHNLVPLIKGPDRCTLLVHPDDAGRLGLRDGGHARVRSRVGEVVAPVEVSDEIMRGVVSLPHGYGHDLPGVRMDVARAHGGVNVNLLSDETVIDAISGNAAFNGVPVTLAAAD